MSDDIKEKCPHCNHFIEKNDTRCSECGRDMKTFNVYNFETAAELVDERFIINTRRKIQTDRYFPFPEQPVRSRLYIWSMFVVVLGFIVGATTFWAGFILVEAGMVSFGKLEYDFRAKKKEYDIAEYNINLYQMYMTEKYYKKDRR